jgi:hypothetical protein
LGARHRQSFFGFFSIVVANGKLLPETRSDCKETRKAVAKKQTKRERNATKLQRNKQKRRNAQEGLASLTLITEH